MISSHEEIMKIGNLTCWSYRAMGSSELMALCGFARALCGSYQAPPQWPGNELVFRFLLQFSSGGHDISLLRWDPGRSQIAGSRTCLPSHGCKPHILLMKQCSIWNSIFAVKTLLQILVKIFLFLFFCTENLQIKQVASVQIESGWMQNAFSEEWVALSCFSFFTLAFAFGSEQALTPGPLSKLAAAWSSFEAKVCLSALLAWILTVAFIVVPTSLSSAPWLKRGWGPTCHIN